MFLSQLTVQPDRSYESFARVMSYTNYNDGGYQQSTYNAGGGQNAGGFVASQGGFKADQKTAGSNTLRPLRIIEVLEAQQVHPDAAYTVDGVELGTNIAIAGRVVNVSGGSTHITFKLDDGTGSIEVKTWSGEPRPEVVKNDSFVRVVGNIKAMGGKRHVNTACIRVVENEKEIKYHELLSKYVHLYLTKGPRVSQDDAYGGGGMMGHGANMSASGQMNEVQQKMNSLDAFSRKVMEAIHGSEAPEGLHVRALLQMLGGREEHLLATIDGLKEEGHLYTTVDEDHLKSTMLQ